VIIQGAVHGDVRASDAIVVEASARVRGNLFAPRIALKEGAKFQGAVDMELEAAGDAKVDQLLESTGS
jgi:cytoskeletal protein CcmA (bactofilin family)